MPRASASASRRGSGGRNDRIAAPLGGRRSLGGGAAVPARPSLQAARALRSRAAGALRARRPQVGDRPDGVRAGAALEAAGPRRAVDDGQRVPGRLGRGRAPARCLVPPRGRAHLSRRARCPARGALRRAPGRSGAGVDRARAARALGQRWTASARSPGFVLTRNDLWKRVLEARFGIPGVRSRDVDRVAALGAQLRRGARVRARLRV